MINTYTEGNPYPQYTPEARVWEVAQAHGKKAAGWVTDGNTSRETYQRLLKGIEEGDPEVLDAYNTPNLSGEWADGYTEADLLEDAGYVRRDGYVLRDELCDQYNSDAAQAFWDEVLRVCRCHRDADPATPQDTWDQIFGSGATNYPWWLKIKFTGVHDGKVEPDWSCEVTCDDGMDDRKTTVVNHAVIMKAARYVISHDIQFMGQAAKRSCRNLVFDADEADFDAVSANNLLQYIVLGEVVFG
jgi:hypothetical protein